MDRLFAAHQIRKTVSLDGLWDFYPEKNPADKRKVMVPSCMETYPGLENYRGRGIYEKEVMMQGNVRLCLKGVSHTACVSLDGKKSGEHYNAYTPFEVLWKSVERGRHKITVTADNTCHEDSSLHVINDYYNYGGISRPVILEELPDIWIARLHFRPYRKEGSWYGKITVCLENEWKPGDVTLCVKLNEEEIWREEIFAESGENRLEKEISFPFAKDYSPESPFLYYLQAVLEKDGIGTDDLIDRVGFRQIRTEGDTIYWNDSPIRIKGYNRHEDHGLFGCAIPPEAMDYDLRLMQESGANAVRTCHYPNDERFLDLCDELGFLVWEESHARGLGEEQMRHKNFRSQSLACIDEMIGNHYNHPSVFTWGILNECASDTEYGREIYKEQITRMRQLDDSRPLTFATCKHFTDICLDLPDIVSLNIYPLWYFDEPVKAYLEKEFEWISRTAGSGKPVIISEIGAGAIPGYHASHKPKWSEERQRDILEAQLKGVLAYPGITGVYIWQFCDCRVPDENFYGRPRCMNNKGVVDEYRRKKLAFDKVTEIFHNME